MTLSAHLQDSDSSIPAPKVLTSWATELHRLATAVEQSIQSMHFAPSVVSSLTAMAPIVDLLSTSLMTVVMNDLSWPDGQDNRQSDDSPQPPAPGYL